MEPKHFIYGNKTIAIYFPSSLTSKEGVSFYTDEQNPFQIGIHNVPQGKKYDAHYHILDKPITLTVIQEILYIVKGKVKVNLYTKKGKLIDIIVLHKGDSILLIDQAHEIEVLEHTEIFEIKQGPYPGVHFAKVYLRSNS